MTAMTWRIHGAVTGRGPAAAPRGVRQPGGRGPYSAFDASEATEGMDAHIELVRRAQAGDERAFAALVPDAADRLLGVAYRILHDGALAEDATQQALLTAWRHIRELRDPERFDAWTYRLVVNACYAEARRRRSWRERVGLNTEQEVRAPDAYSAVDDRDVIERGFRRLSLDHRAVLVLHHYVDLPLTEVARLLGIPVGTARSRLHYAVRALRASMATDAEQVPMPGQTR